jgi:hypothetical protein
MAFHSNSIRHSSAMTAAPDHATFKNGWWCLNENLARMRDTITSPHLFENPVHSGLRYDQRNVPNKCHLHVWATTFSETHNRSYAVTIKHGRPPNVFLHIKSVHDFLLFPRSNYIEHRSLRLTGTHTRHSPRALPTALRV